MTVMFNELGRKEIINLNNGERLGAIIDVDIVVDEESGKIISLLVPDSKIYFKIFGESADIEIPWEAIKKIGNDMVIVEI